MHAGRALPCEGLLSQRLAQLPSCSPGQMQRASGHRDPQPNPQRATSHAPLLCRRLQASQGFQGRPQWGHQVKSIPRRDIIKS